MSNIHCIFFIAPRKYIGVLFQPCKRQTMVTLRGLGVGGKDFNFKLPNHLVFFFFHLEHIFFVLALKKTEGKNGKGENKRKTGE